MAAWIAWPKGMQVAYSLAGVFMIFGLYVYQHSSATQPDWYRALLLPLTPLMLILGGWLATLLHARTAGARPIR